jgi:adenine-specific DNA-methyltransferase
MPRRFVTASRSPTPMFDGVQDGCIVLIGRGFTEPTQRVVRYEHESADALIAALPGSRSALENDPLAAPSEPSRPSPTPDGTRRLGDVLSVRLGGVTGDARYFLLTESERLKHGLPTKCLRTVVSKARHLVAAELTRAHWDALRASGERVWLFDPPPSVISHPAVRAYLELPPQSDGCRRDRYKISGRSPWYRTPLPKFVDGFLSGMTQLRPWICLRSMPRLTATNTLYSLRFHGRMTQDEKAAWGLSLLTSHARRLLEPVGRLYPDGLVKYEPGDLLDLPLVVPVKVDEARVWYLETVRALLTGHPEKATQMADRWFDLE